MLTALLIKTLYGAGAALVGWLGHRAAKHVGQATAQRGVEVANRLLDDAVRRAVHAVEQQVRRRVVGKLSEQQCDDLRRDAMGRIFQILGPQGLALVERGLRQRGAALSDNILHRLEAATFALPPSRP